MKVAQFFLLLCVVCAVSTAKTPDPKKRSKLLENYDVLALPNYGKKETPYVTVTISSLTLTYFTINEEEQQFELEAWPAMSWQDDRLQWDRNTLFPPAGYLHFHPDEIFIPDITLYNNAKPNELNIFGKTQCIVNWNGTVTWVPPAKFVSYCDLNLRKWPRDVQNCTIKLGSWTYDSEEVNIVIGKDDEEIKTPAELTKNDMEWELLSADATWHAKKYECCEELYTSVRYEFIMQRRSTIYTYTVIVPLILVSLVTIITFLLPAHKTERLLLGSMNFLTISVYMIFFRTRLPEVDHVPYIVIIYGWNLLAVSINLLTTVVATTAKTCDEQKQPPKFLDLLNTSLLTSLLCMGSGSDSGKKAVDKANAVEDGGQMEDEKMNVSETEKNQSAWSNLISIIDRLTFCVYAAITIVLLICYLS